MNKESVMRQEKEGRDLFYWVVSATSQNVEFTQELYDRVDGYMTGATGVKSVFEIKRRDIQSDKYDTILLEKIKYDALMKEMKDKGEDKALYINIFNDKYCVWDVSKISPKWLKIRCTSTTLDGEYGKKTEMKEVCLLDKKDALWIKNRL